MKIFDLYCTILLPQQKLTIIVSKYVTITIMDACFIISSMLYEMGSGARNVLQNQIYSFLPLCIVESQSLELGPRTHRSPECPLWFGMSGQAWAGRSHLKRQTNKQTKRNLNASSSH